MVPTLAQQNANSSPMGEWFLPRHTHNTTHDNGKRRVFRCVCVCRAVRVVCRVSCAVPDAAGVSAVDGVQRLEGEGKEHRRRRNQTRKLVLLIYLIYLIY
jgi:hypothetical protein